MELTNDFTKFLKDIRPTAAQIRDLKNAHIRLRDRLMKHEGLKERIIETFLQGSYRRHTAVRPRQNTRPDVDIIIVTNNDVSTDPAGAMGEFKPFLKEHYKDKWRTQGRSFGVEMSKADLDVVITAAPPEEERFALVEWLRAFIEDDDESAPNWKHSPLWIPDRVGGYWEETDPLNQISWTKAKNEATNGHFINVVKALKWWRLENPTGSKHPKGFPLERLVGACCPDSITSVPEGVVLTLESIRDQCSSYAKPGLPDYGVPSHDVFAQLDNEDWIKFHDAVEGAATIARAALESDDLDESRRWWRALFGSKFPGPKGGGSKRSDGGGGFDSPDGPSNPGSGRFA